jgi:ATP-dependent Clp protease ATP-binding subunit ClpC
MFERYTQKARRTIFFARYEASQFGSNSIETEHLLLGLLREDQELACRIGLRLSAIASIREEIEKSRPRGEKVPTSVEMPLSQQSKRILAYAAEEAGWISGIYVGTEHLLLGILREKDCYAARKLNEHGVDLEKAREKAVETKEEKAAATDPPEKATARFYKSTPSGGPILNRHRDSGEEESSLLSEFLGDVGREASEGKLDPLIGREAELDRVIEILCLRSRNNPVLIGETGVGKSALVEGLALLIASGEAPARLQAKRILALDLPTLVTVLSASRQFEDRVNAAVRDLEQMQDAIFYVEGLFVSTGERTLGAAKILKPLLDRGALQCIAAALPAEHQKWVEREPWLDEHFYAVAVPPPGEADAIKILLTIKKRYEDFHGVTYSDEALKHAVYYSERFLPKRHLPDKAIDLIDEAGAAAAVRRSQLPEEVTEVKKRLKLARGRLENAVASHEFEKARLYDQEEQNEREKLLALEEQYHLGPGSAGTVGVEEIENVLARWTNMPIENIRQERRKA